MILYYTILYSTKPYRTVPPQAQTLPSAMLPGTQRQTSNGSMYTL